MSEVEKPAAPELPLEDQQWLEWGKANLLATHDIQDAAAQRLLTATGWVWTLYTTVTLIGTALSSHRLSVWQAVLLALPIALLLVAYLLGTWVTSPIAINPDRRSPTELREAHEKVTLGKQKRLRRAEAMLAVAAVSVAVGVGVSAYAQQPVDPTLVVEVASESRSASLTARLPDVPEAMLRVIADEETVFGWTVLVDDGRVEETVELPEGHDTVDVALSWVDDGLTRSISRTIEVAR